MIRSTCAILTLALIGCAAQAGTNIQGCPIYPADNVWNQDISTAPIDSNSDNYITYINAGGKTFIHPDFGSVFGIPFTVVGAAQAPVPITFGTPDESDPGPYPIPPNAPIEGGSDAHVLVLDKDNALLYEMFASKFTNPGWSCSSGAVFDLKSNALRPDGFTSADAAGLPILAGLARYDEAAAGAITHALRFTVRATAPGYIHPATHRASTTSDPNAPPMGLRLRLKLTYSLAGMTGKALVVATALQHYGMYVADNGSDWFVSGEQNSNWSDTDLDQLKTIPGNMFEVVQAGTVLTASSSTQPPPTIGAPPASQTVTAGQTATFTVTANGTGTLQYQWQRGGQDIAGARSPSYTTAATSTTDSGASFTVRVTSAGGSVTSTAATLTVNPGSGGTGTATGTGTGTGTGIGGGINGGSPGALNVTKLTVRLNFAHPGNDTIQLTGQLNLPTGFVPLGQAVTFNIGSVTESFLLDKRGVFSNHAAANFRLRYKAKRGAVSQQVATYTGRFRGDFAGALAGSGLTNATTAPNTSVMIPISAVFLGTSSQTIITKLYVAKLGRTGMAR
jgi:hypothetical protein